MIRQSAHMRMRSIIDDSANIQCLPASFAITRSTEVFVPNGLPQRMHSAGSSVLRRTGLRRWSPKASRGSSPIAASGQVVAHNPH